MATVQTHGNEFLNVEEPKLEPPFLPFFSLKYKYIYIYAWWLSNGHILLYFRPWTREADRWIPLPHYTLATRFNFLQLMMRSVMSACCHLV